MSKRFCCRRVGTARRGYGTMWNSIHEEEGWCITLYVRWYKLRVQPAVSRLCGYG
jgi:hypothetical protein